MLPLPEIGARVRRAREEGGRSLDELAVALGVDRSVVEHLETGRLDPLPGDYLLIIARILRVDFRYFISTDLDEAEEETRRIYRAMSSPNPHDRFAIRRFMIFAISEAELEQLLGINRPLRAPSYATRWDRQTLFKTQGMLAAREERKRLGLGVRPVENVFELLRNQGARLFRHALDDSVLSGLTALHPVAGVCVLINYTDDLYRQFFSAAHEYAHVLFDREQVRTDGCVVSYESHKNDLVELRANFFAAEFLLPTDSLSTVRQPTDLVQVKAAIESLAMRYRVNPITAAIRLQQAGWISQRTLESFKKVKPVRIRRAEKADPDIPADLTASQQERRALAAQEGISSNLLELIRRALVEGQISLGRAAEMLDMTVQEVLAFFAATGIAL